MDSKEAYEVAVAALTALVQERGTDAVFPLDAIWQYATKDVPSKQRPGVQRPLLRNKYIEATGGMATAESERRAGSPTKEYRPGSMFMPPPEEANAPSGSITLPSVSAALTALVSAMDARGFIVLPEQVTNFYLALLSSPMVIMTGTSGTGKSWLPRIFAELTGSRFSIVPVKPQWDDNCDMFGYTPPLQTTQFVQGAFTKAILAANENSAVPYIVLLDEMNLAAVEHYFSDFLSVIETRSRKNGTVVTDALPLELPPAPSEGPDQFASLRTLSLPAHVRVVGTANMDETTRPFSPKVLDRAFSIEFEDVDLSAFPVGSTGQVDATQFSVLASRLADTANPVNVTEAHSRNPEVCEEAAAYLETIRSILAPAGISFAYRTRDAVCYYMSNWQRDNLESVLPKDDALDYCILQKVLPKIHGQGQVLRDVLSAFGGWLRGEQVPDAEAGPGFPRSAAKLERMLKRLDADGTTTYWGT
jgi:MoxR-like ATPase